MSRGSRNTFWLVKAVFLASLLLFVLGFHQVSKAAAPESIPFGAILTTASGSEVPDGSYSITFRLYTGATGGSAIWSEVQNVTVTQGELAVDLGSVTSLAGLNFNQQLYLSFQVDSDPEMSPRYAFDSVPYALNANQLDGKDQSKFVQTDANNILSASGTALTVNNDVSIGGSLNVNGVNIASGIITNATWQGTAVGLQYGGTGASSFTSNGVLYGNGTGALQVTASGTSGQLLMANASGVPNFVALSGDATVNSSGVISLSNTGAVSGTYGSNSIVPQITVDSKGRITSVSNVVLSGLPPGGPAGGDLSGSFPTPTVAEINGATLGSTTPTAGNLLIGSGSQWATQALSGDATLTSGGALTVANAAITGAKIANDTITATNLASGNFSGKITSGNYSINVTGNAATVTNGVYTGAANVLTAPSDSAVSLSVHPASGTATGDILDLYGKSGSLVSYFDVNGIFNGSGAGLTSIPNSSLTHASVTVNSGTGLSGGGSVALGSSITLTNTGVTSLSGTTNQVNASASTGAVTLSLPQNIDTGASPSFAGGAFAGNVTVGSLNGATITSSGINGLNIASGVISSGTWQGTPVGVGFGGTGGNTQATARSGIGAAASGANSDITSLSALSTALSVAQGGTGAASATTNGLLFGNGTGALQVTAAGTSGQLLVANASGVPTFVSLSGDAASLSNTGALTLATVNSNTGTFGSGTQVAQLTVDGKGRITAASNVTITGAAPIGTAGGDLSGSFPNPTVAQINGVALGSTTATAGNLLIGSGAAWVSQSVGGDATLGSTGTITIAAGAVTGSKIASSTITATNLAAGDYSAKINSGTYSINVSGNAATVSNGVYTNAANVIVAPSDAAVPLSLKPVASTGTGNVLNIYNNAGTPAIASYFDSSGLFNGSGAGLTSIPNTALTHNSFSTSFGTGISGSASVALGGNLTINNTGVTSAIGTSNQVNVSGSTGAVTFSLPQNINTGASPTFAGATINGAITGVTTIATSSTINGATISGGTLSGGSLSGTAVNGLNVASGIVSSGTWNGSAIGAQYGGTGDASLTSNGLLFGNGTGAVQVTAAGTSGQLLVANSSGVPTFVSLSGDASLAATGVVTLPTVNSNTGTFGSSTEVAQLTIDGKGRITAAGNVTITGAAPTGSAGGDLSGSFPNPTVAKINNVALGSTTATAGNLLIGSGSQWVSQGVSGDVTINSSGVTAIGAGKVSPADLATGDFSSEINSGTYSINVSGNAATVSNGVYTNAANILTAPSNSAVPLSIKPVATTGTGDTLDIYNNAGTPVIASFFDDTGLFNGSGAGITASTIANSSLAHNSISTSFGTGISGSGSVALGGTLTINNTGVTSITGTSNQVIASAGTGAVTLSLPQSIDTGSAPTFAGATLNGAVTITATANPQLTVKYDGSNYYTTAVASNGATTFDATGSGAAFGFADGVTANTFASSGATLTGGSINGTTIGATTASSGQFTSLSANSGLTVSAGGAAVTGTTTINTSGTASTSIGNSTGTFALASSALNISTAGSITGIGTALTAGGAVNLQATSGTLGLIATGANIISFTTNGVQAAEFNSAGQLGIGTTVGQHSLEIAGLLTSTAPKGTYFSVDNLEVGQLDRGVIVGKTDVSENQLSVANIGNNWISEATSQNWAGVAMSSDGKVQTAIVYGGNIYVSTNYGVTWTSEATSQNWAGVAMSADGKYQTATSNVGHIYISSDYGATWTSKGGSLPWQGVAMSSDGKVQTAVTNFGNIYISGDYGATWTSKGSSLDWIGAAMSADGKYQTATVYGGNIYTSNDYGNTWTSKATSQNWYWVVMSADGKYQTATVYGGNIYTSNDYGNTWTSTASSQNWYGLAMSSDGKVTAAALFAGNIYESYADSSLNGNLDLVSAPAASATASLLQLGGAIASGSSSGTYIGANAASGYGGNLVDLQVNGGSKIKVDASGNLTIAGTFTGGTSGALGYLSRSGTTLSPTTSGDNFTTSGNLSTSGSGTIASAGLLTGNAGLTISGGTASINTSGTSNTSIGNSTGTFGLTSSGLNVSTGGNLTGVGTAITAAAGVNLQATAATLGLVATGANPITFTTNGVQAGEFDASGNLQIGTTIGKHEVEIAGTTSVTNPKAAYLSVDNLEVGQFDGGAVLGRTDVSENQLSANNFGNAFTSTATSQSWRGLALSSNGKYQFTGIPGTAMYLSSDYGNTFTSLGNSSNYTGLAMSQDGQVQAFTVNNNQIKVSTNYGVTWTAVGPGGTQWDGIAMSADGKYMTAAVNGGAIYTSSNFGATWTAGISQSGYAVAMSSDGKIQAITDTASGVYTSYDYGATWTQRSPGSVSTSMYGIAMSADGKYMSTVLASGTIEVSSNYGVTWTAEGTSQSWLHIAMSADGRIQAADVSSGQVYISSNYGVTWAASGSSSLGWNGLAMSADGKVLAGVVNGGNIYESYADSSLYGNLKLVSVPNVSATASLLQLGSAIVSGSSSGTYIGANAASGYGGNLVDLQVNGTSELKVTAGGATTVNGALTVNSGGETITAGGLNINSTGITNAGSIAGASSINASGAIQGGSFTDGTATLSSGSLASAVNGTFTGTVQAANLNATSAIKLGGTSINTAGTLTNVAYLNQANAFTAAQTITSTANPQLTVAYDGTHSTTFVTNSSGNLTVAPSGGATSVTGTLATSGALTVSSGGASISGGLNNNSGAITNAGSITGIGTALTASGAVNLQATSGTLGLIATGANIISFTTNGVQAAEFNSAGQLGIGTTVGQHSLEIAGLLTSTAPKGTYFSVDNLEVGQLDRGVVIGRSDVSENQLAVANIGNNWTSTASSQSWLSIAVSADGKYQTGTVVGGNIYISSDYGTTWTSEASSHNWYSVAMSADGKIQTAIVVGGNIYVSTNYGVTWTSEASSRSWEAVAMSADGKIQTATVFGGNIYVSTNYGVTWTSEATTRNWLSVAMSADGKIQMAPVASGNIYVSSDYGVTWTSEGTTRSWYGVAMSADGKYQTATAGNIYISSDYGVTWTSEATSQNWYGIAMSASGQIQTAVNNGGNIYISNDYGNTWTSKASSQSWYSVAMSGDGKVMTGVVNGGNIYESYADSSLNGNLDLASAPAASATASLLQLGGAIASGSSSGTYIGANAASGYAGNLVDLQVNGTSEFRVTAAGATTVNGALVVASGGETITAGGLNVNATGISNAGAISGATTIATSSTINGQTVSSSANFTGTITAASLLTLSGTGANQFAVAGAPTNSATSSLIQFGAPIVGGNTASNGGTYLGINIPGSGAGSAADIFNFQANGTSVAKLTSAGVLTVASCSGCGGAGSFIAKNANDTSSASYVGTLLGLTNSSTGAAGVLSLANAGTSSALAISQSGNPTAGQALILANNTNGSASGNLLDLQVGGVSKLSVTTAGNLATIGTINTDTLSATALTFSGSTPAISASTAGTSISLDAGTTGAINIGSTSTGDINLGGGSGSTGCTVTNSSGNFTCTATVQSATVNATTSLQLNGSNINTAGTLTNVAYQNQANTFASNQVVHTDDFTAAFQTTSTGGTAGTDTGGYTNVTSSANGASNWNIFKSSAVSNARTYFGYAPGWTLMNFAANTSPAPAGGTVVFEYCAAATSSTCTSWQTVLEDDSAGFTNSDDVDFSAWADTQVPVTINGITAYWLRATVTSSMTTQANGLVSINSQNNTTPSSVAFLIQDASSPDATWNSSGTALGVNSQSIGDLISLRKKGTSIFTVSTGIPSGIDGDFLSFGVGATSTGASSIALGDSSTAASAGSVALGVSANSTGDYSTAIGYEAYTGARGAVAIGTNVGSSTFEAFTYGSGASIYSGYTNQTTYSQQFVTNGAAVEYLRGGPSYVGAGTVDTTSGSTAVTGSGTTFTNDFVAGDRIAVGSDTYTIASVADDTDLVLTANATTTVSTSAYSILPAILKLQDSSSNAVLFASDQGGIGINTTDPIAQLDVEPKTPTYIGTETTNNNLGPVTSQGNYVYATNEYSGGIVYTYDTSIPSAPEAAGGVEIDGAQDSSGIAVSGKYLYTVDGTLRIFDISNPSAPVLMSDTSTGGGRGIQVQGKYAYIQGDVQIFIYDISNPSAPVFVSSSISAQYSHSFKVSGKFVYVWNDENGGADALGIYDVSNPASPVQVSLNNFCVSVCDFNNASGKSDMMGNYLLTLQNSNNEAHNYLRIINVANPASPTSVAAFQLSDVPYGLAVEGHTAYVTLLSGKLLQIDLSNPANPVLLASITTNSGQSDNSLDLTVEGRYAYVTTDGGLEVYDLGGVYLPQVETAGLQATTVSVQNSAQIGGNLSVLGGINSGGSIQAGSLAVTGGASYTGNLISAQSNGGNVLTLSQSGNLSQAAFSFQNVFQTTTAESSFTDVSSEANAPNNWNFFENGAVVNDRTYFGYSDGAFTGVDFNVAAGAQSTGTITWEVCTAETAGTCTSWDAAAGDDTVNLTNTGEVHWTTTPVMATVNGVSAYWLRATVTTADMTTQANGTASVSSPGSSVAYLLQPANQAAGTTFTGSTNGTLLGVNAPANFIGNFLDFQQGGSSVLKISSYFGDPVLTDPASGTSLLIGTNGLEIRDNSSENHPDTYIGAGGPSSFSDDVYIDSVDTPGSNTNSPALVFGGYGYTPGPGDNLGFFSLTNQPSSATTAKLVFQVNGFVSSARVMSLDQAGNAIFAGTSTASSTPDVAEYIGTTSGVNEGTVVVAAPGSNGNENFVATPNTVLGNPSVIGVISDSTASVQINSYGQYVDLKTGLATGKGQPMTLAGRIMVKIKGSVKQGDLLMASDQAGFAQKYDPTAGSVVGIIGVALNDFTGTTGKVMAQIQISRIASPTSVLSNPDLSLNSLTVSGSATFNGGITVAGNSTFNGPVKVVQQAVGELGFFVQGISGATADLIHVEDSNHKVLFAVDVTGKLVNGDSVAGVPVVGVDPNSGATPGDLTTSAGPLRPSSNGGLQLKVSAGSAYTANAATGQTEIDHCALPSDTTITLADNATEYVYLTANGAPSTSGITCEVAHSTTLPDFNPSQPVLVIAKTVTNNGVLSSVADTRFFIGGTLTYVKTATNLEPGSVVVLDPSADNQVMASTTAASTGVSGIIVVGNTGAGQAIMMTSGQAWTQSLTDTVRSSCAGTSSSAAKVTNVTPAVTVCVGQVRSTASESLPAVLVSVTPN